jgi:hypothetical protein
LTKRKWGAKDKIYGAFLFRVMTSGRESIIRRAYENLV